MCFSMETNIFDFNKNIYNHLIKIIFVERIRDEVKFENLETLKQQIKNDKVSAIKILSAR